MTIYEEKAEAIKQAVIILEQCITNAEEVGLRVDMTYRSKEPIGYRYIETVIALPILHLP